MWDYIFKNYELTNEEKTKIRYVLTSLLYDISKILILGIIFYLTGHLIEYSVCTLIMIFIRPGIGGIHFKHYITCFLFSFFIIGCSVFLSDYLDISKSFCLILLTVSMIIFSLTEPVETAGRKKPDSSVRLKLHVTSIVKIALYLLAVYILPFSRPLAAGSFLLGFLSLQLTFAYCLEKKIHRVAVSQIFFICLSLFEFMRFY